MRPFGLWPLSLAAALCAPAVAAALDCADFPDGSAVDFPTAGMQTDIDIAYGPDGDLHAVWSDARSGLADIYYACSTDGGQIFGPNVKVNWSNGTATNSFIQGGPTLDVDPAGIIYVAWTDERGGFPDTDIYVSKSTDGGVSFTQEVRANVSITAGEQSFQALRATPGGTIYVAWIDHSEPAERHLYLTRALPGQPFEPERRVNRDPVWHTCECCSIDLAVVGESTVFATYMANLNYIRNLWLSRSTDAGMTFDPPIQLNDGDWYEPACPTSAPRLQIGPDGHLNAVWLDRHEGVSHVYYARSTNGGQSIIQRTRLSQAGELVMGHPNLAITPDGALHTVWEFFNETLSAVNLNYSRSTDSGLSFSPPCAVSGGAPYFQWAPSAAASPAGDLALAWHDERTGSPDVYVAMASGASAVGDAAGAPRSAWQAAPNPFRDWVGISPVGPAALAVFDVHGRMVREVRASGALGWDGRDDRGRPVAPGTYFLRLPVGTAALRVTRLP